MTRRTSTSPLAIALILATVVISATVIASAATLSRFGVRDVVTRNAAIAPRFDPVEPTLLDEFASEKDVRSVHFDFDKATLGPSEVQILEANARWLNDHTPYEVVVAGFADERGTKPYNVALGKRRAMAVKDALIANGVPPDRITIVSYGEARSECRMKVRSESCWSKNRRADIFVRQMPVQNP